MIPKLSIRMEIIKIRAESLKQKTKTIEKINKIDIRFTESIYKIDKHLAMMMREKSEKT